MNYQKNQAFYKTQDTKDFLCSQAHHHVQAKKKYCYKDIYRKLIMTSQK